MLLELARWLAHDIRAFNVFFIDIPFFFVRVISSASVDL